MQGDSLPSPFLIICNKQKEKIGSVTFGFFFNCLCLIQGYQFWAIADEAGYFSIENVRPGDYNLYAWVPGFIGDYHNDTFVSVTSGKLVLSSSFFIYNFLLYINQFLMDINNTGCKIEMGDIVYEPPRDGPTLWEIGIPDRKASEFFIPDPDPMLVNRALVHHQDRFLSYTFVYIAA